MKITRATIKSFVNKNRDHLYINCISSFSGMTDGVEYNVNSQFQPIKPTSEKFSSEHNLGIMGLWLVGRSRDSFEQYNDRGYKGFRVYNSCGSCILAVKA